MDKVIPVGIEMFFSIFSDIEKYFGFVLTEKNKLFFEVEFIECLLVFALLVWGEEGVHGVYRDWETDRKSTRLNSSHITRSRMPSSA